MSHSADFSDAHRRHWEDAELLYKKCRWANADQLYGFSAECGLKAVMKVFKMPVDEEGVPQREHRQHVQCLWPEFTSFMKNRDGAEFIDMLPAGMPFEDWSHHDRYAASIHFGPSVVNSHRDAASRILLMVERAEQEGRL